MIYIKSRWLKKESNYLLWGSWMVTCAIFALNCQNGSKEKDFRMSSISFIIFLLSLSSLEKKPWPFIYTNFNSFYLIKGDLCQAQARLKLYMVLKKKHFFMLLMFLFGFSLFRYYLTLKRGTSLENKKEINVLFPTKDTLICATCTF